MSDDLGQKQTECPLSTREQTRNLVLYGAIVGLVYLAAPVIYVGIVHAALCQHLGKDEELANLPTTIYLCTTPLPVLVAWRFPYVRLLRTVLAVNYLVMAAVGGVVVVALLLPTSDWIIPALIGHAAVLGCAIGVHGTFLWEMLGRGVAESRRGQALALAFGAGPMLAALSSLAQQLILTGAVGPLHMPRIAYPWNFAVLFAASVPILSLAALLATRFVVPMPAVEVTRQPFVAGVFGGFGQYLGYRLILFAVVAEVLVYSGYNVMTTISLYAPAATGHPSADYAGYMNTLRFGCKVGAGFFLGWLLTRTHAKAGMLVTCGLCLAAVLWALAVPGEWFLLSFGLMGAGELFGIYYPNYILSCSPKSKMRRNMAFTGMMNMPAAVSPVLFGFIAKRTGEVYGKVDGFRLSFLAALLILGGSFLVVLFALPSRPRPRPADMEPSDWEMTPAAAVSESRSTDVQRNDPGH